MDPDVAKLMDDVRAKSTAAGILLVEKDIPDIGELTKKLVFSSVI